MNMGYEEDELKPYQEAQTDLNDQKRIGKTGTVQKTKKFEDFFREFFFRFTLNSNSVEANYELNRNSFEFFEQWRLVHVMNTFLSMIN